MQQISRLRHPPEHMQEVRSEIALNTVLILKTSENVIASAAKKSGRFKVIAMLLSSRKAHTFFSEPSTMPQKLQKIRSDDLQEDCLTLHETVLP